MPRYFMVKMLVLYEACFCVHGSTWEVCRTNATSCSLNDISQGRVIAPIVKDSRVVLRYYPALQTSNINEQLLAWDES